MKLFLKKSWPFLTLAALAFTAHFAFLAYPSQVVFDEVHFGKFVGAYFTHQYYFDIHPPLGKLLIAGWAKLNGVNPVFSFDKIGEPIPANTLFVLRCLPALAGALFVLLFAWLAYLLSRSRAAALIAGSLILLDNAFLIQSKFILVDIFMLFFGLMTFCFFFLWQRQKNYSIKRFLYLVLAGIFFGLTISVKWTGVATIGIIGLLLLIKVIQTRSWKENFLALIFMLIIGLTIYTLPFYAHFQLLQKSGPGDAFMSQPFQQELKFGRDSVYQPLTFWQKFFELNKTMYTANASITSEHPFGSRWYSWPLGYKPVYYWQAAPTADHKTANIYFAGNLFLWWLVFISVLGTIIALAIKKWRSRFNLVYYFLIIAFFANLLPFIFIKRVSFLYHYLPSISFGILLFSLYLANLLSYQKKIVFVILGLIIVSFLFLAPLSYGWPMPTGFYQFQLKFINLFN